VGEPNRFLNIRPVLTFVNGWKVPGQIFALSLTALPIILKIKHHDEGEKMGRPKKCRWVETEPGVTFFKPRGIPLRSLQQIVITVDELEAMRLADFLEMTQEEVAQRMQVSRPTVTRMLSRVHRAVAEALVHGKAICIQGGDYQVGQHCQWCGQWFVQGPGDSITGGCSCRSLEGEADQPETKE
jgi:predicted DNA-binding protein (UPF0251 family)